MTPDEQGLVAATGTEWKDLAADAAWFTYRGGRHGAGFYAYLVGAERAGGRSELPPPSLQNLEVVVMYAERDGWLCHLCGLPVSKRITDASYTRFRASPDHLTPRFAGGSDYPSNIKTSHLSCNKARRDMDLEQWHSRRDALLTHGALHE